jgi:DNA-binding CsgD family transcriptional regulator
LVAAGAAGGHPWSIHADAAHLSQLLERERELAQLEAALASAAAGAGALAVVEGSAGIGKTQLLAVTRRAARERGMRDLSARGAELERDFPYGVVRQLLEPAVASERDELLRGAAALAAPLFGAVAAPPAGSDASFAVLHGLHWLVAGLGARASLVLTVDAAVDTLAGADARLEHARALCDLGAALRRANRRADARAPLREALDLAHRCRAAAVAGRARTELLATGARPRRLVLSGVESLTPSERRVAAMAADGLSNPQIAQALFVSTRTVEGHLTHVFRKLDATARIELRERMR